MKHPWKNSKIKFSLSDLSDSEWQTLLCSWLVIKYKSNNNPSDLYSFLGNSAQVS